MPSHIKVENNVVVQCLSYLPEIHDGDWREAIEINPNCIPNRQMIGAHSFDLTKSPVEIIWEVIDISVEERKQQLQSNLKFNTKESYDYYITCCILYQKADCLRTVMNEYIHKYKIYSPNGLLKERNFNNIYSYYFNSYYDIMTNVNNINIL